MASADYDHLVHAAQHRATGPMDIWTYAYVTDGGTWVLGSIPGGSDNDRPRDLIAVLPAAAEKGSSRVLMLRPNVHPELVKALREALDTPVEAPADI